jgi:trehalose-6-phosphatase
MKNKKKLVIMDFDDTLVISDEHSIIITHEDGTIIELNGKDWSKYSPKPGDIYDFSHLEHLKNPRPIHKTWKTLLDRLYSLGPENVHILTARSSQKPLEKYFRDHGVLVPVHGLGIPPGQNNGIHKARWIEEQIAKGGWDIIEFFDDRDDCVTEVLRLKEKYQNILFFVWQIKDEDMFYCS